MVSIKYLWQGVIVIKVGTVTLRSITCGEKVTALGLKSKTTDWSTP